MPPRICIIPTPAEDRDSEIISLPHPRSAVDTRYFLHPTKGLHEFTKIPPSTAEPRSWLLHAPKTLDPEAEPPQKDAWLGDGQIIQDGSLYIATPLDPLFLLLPILLPDPQPSTPSFIPLDDLIDSLLERTSRSAHWSRLLAPSSKSRAQIESRIRTISDSVPLDSDSAYRVSLPKILRTLTRKCESIASSGLPANMEEEFISKPLIRPVTESQNITTETVEISETKTADDPDAGTTTVSTETETTTTSSVTTTLEVRPSPQTPPEILHLLRLRVAAQYISALYLPAHISTLLLSHLATLHSFETLDTHLAELKRLRNEAFTARSGDFSLKRGHEDMEAAEARAEVKRKKEEAEKKAKKNVSQGVRNLGKVNTRGMAKMTSFFKKKE